MFSKRLLDLLKPSTRVCVLTGAGVSAESGVPTFRDKDGLWRKFKPQELANMDAFLANPDLVWEWYEHRRQLIREVRPNAGHVALVDLEKYFDVFTLATQNVDGLHQVAGSNQVLELHGNILRSFCVICKTTASEKQMAAIAARKMQPNCLACEGRLRPDVVWFGEMLPADVLSEAQKAAESCELFLTIGTSGAVYPAAGLPLTARQHGAYVVEINAQESELSPYVDEVLRGNSAQILPELINRIP